MCLNAFVQAIAQHYLASISGLAIDPISLDASHVHKNVNIHADSYVNLKSGIWLGIQNLCKKVGEIWNLTRDYWVVSDPLACRAYGNNLSGLHIGKPS